MVWGHNECMDQGVGASLLDARSRRKLSLADVEAVTKIRARYLRALENEEWDELPGDAYARAFVRTYAGYLGLDAERLAEEVRQGSGALRPGERLPRVDPRPHRAQPQRLRRGPRVSPKLVAALVSAGLVALLIGIGISGGGGGGGAQRHPAKQSAGGGHHGRQGKGGTAPPPGHVLTLVATGEVWVCLLGNGGSRIVDGLILYPGEKAGPFRSASFTMAFGNGAVKMMVDGKQAHIEESSSPVGFSIGNGGALRDLPAGERPSCV